MIHADSLSSMLAIENNRENNPILNQINDILAELHNQGKQIILGKVLAHIGFKKMKRQTSRNDYNKAISYLLDH